VRDRAATTIGVSHDSRSTPVDATASEPVNIHRVEREEAGLRGITFHP
jgi:hypothetical protein